MSIHYCKERHVFTLHTQSATYQMIVDSHGYLLHCYYGAKIEKQDLSYCIQPQDRGFAANPPDAAGDRTLSPDTLPQEYSSFGVGDFRESCLDVRGDDGSVAADLRYTDHRIYAGKRPLYGLPATYGTEKDVDTLEIDLQDEISGLKVTLRYSVFAKWNVIARSVEVLNRGTGILVLNRVLSCCLDEPVPRMRDIITFYGRHMGERNLERTPLRHGKIRVDSMRGASSPHYNPFVILCDSNTTETLGNCCAFSFVYSGNFMAQAETDQIDTLRFVMGIAPQNFSWELAPGTSFQAPEVLMCFSDAGLDTLSTQLNGFQLRHLMRGKYRTERCPILVNNWEATYFDFDEQKLLDLAQVAKEVGIEMLVLDDGWFGQRNDDTTSLGDWVVNLQKLPEGLAGLGSRINALGLQFGLWFEPEMVSPISSLMESHPDWCLHIPGRKNATSRSQYVLDMGSAAVQEYLFQQMSELIREAKLTYIKWDMNRSITNAHSTLLPPHRQGEIWHRYILGVYALMERLLNGFPELLIESCASGGGRYDAGMLYYSPQVWASDNTDAIDRLKIQYGNSFGFPMKSMGSHVSICPNHQTGRVAPLNTRAIVAMSGSFGYEMDLTKLSDTEKNQVKLQTERFKRQWRLHQLGEYHRLTDAQSDRWFTAWQVVAEDKSAAIIHLVLLAPRANAPVLSVRLRGLQKHAVYEDNFGNHYTGQALMNAGLVFSPMLGEYTALQIELNRIN